MSIVAVVACTAAAACAWPAPVVIDHAGAVVVEAGGFRVHVVGELLAHPDLCAEVLATLRADLGVIREAVPRDAYDELAARVPIWIEHRGAVVEGGMSGRGMVFHPSGVWLRANGLDPMRAGAVEIVRAEDYLAWREHQPMMVLHELAHAVHHLLSADDAAPIGDAFDAARASGVYDSVAYADREERRRAYALTSDREYFAEISEAYFGRNDFAPFDREALIGVDPRGAALVASVWSGFGAAPGWQTDQGGE